MKAILVSAVVALVASAIAGSFMNIIALCTHVGESVGLIVGRAVGIFIPFVGAILGWL